MRVSSLECNFDIFLLVVAKTGSERGENRQDQNDKLVDCGKDAARRPIKSAFPILSDKLCGLVGSVKYGTGLSL